MMLRINHCIRYQLFIDSHLTMAAGAPAKDKILLDHGCTPVVIGLAICEEECT
jgi:hypothetical protein